MVQLEPLRKREAASDDPIYHLDDLAVEGDTASNEEIDREVYGL